jgi:hypothetical protein
MIRRFLCCILFLFITCFGKAQSLNMGKLFVENSFGVFKYSTNSSDLYSHPFLGNIKVGYFIKC